MWPYRRRLNINNNNNNNEEDCNCSPKSRRPPSSPNFKRRTFKDIETLTHDDDMVPNSSTLNDEASSSGSGSIQRPSVFHRVHLANRFTRAFSARPKPEENIFPLDTSSQKHANPNNACNPCNNTCNTLKKYQPKITIPGSEKRVVVYITSLRAVRSTFEACRTVRSILQGFRVPVDERDLMMDASFFDEIRKIMAQIGQGRINSRRVPLPQVFIRGRYIGGADEVVELHEMGELKKFVSGLPTVKPGVCEVCGGFRFYLCEECYGSHKCPLEDGGFTVCTVCNENGLIRCTTCLSD